MFLTPSDILNIEMKDGWYLSPTINSLLSSSHKIFTILLTSTTHLWFFSSADKFNFHCEIGERLLGMEVQPSEERMFLINPVHDYAAHPVSASQHSHL